MTVPETLLTNDKLTPFDGESVPSSELAGLMLMLNADDYYSEGLETPARYLIGYAGAAFYGIGPRPDNLPPESEAEKSRQELADYLMRTCPAGCCLIALALHNKGRLRTGQPLIRSWKEYANDARNRGVARAH